MKSINDLKTLQSFEELSLLEMAIWNFFQGNSSHKVPLNELILGLEYYGEALTIFWSSQFSLDNLEIFLKQDYLKAEATNYFFNLEETRKISGKINLQTNVFSDSLGLGKLLSLINPVVVEYEISILKENLMLLEDSLDKNIEVLLVRESQTFYLKLVEEKAEPNNLQKCLSLLSISLVGVILFSSSTSLAKDKNAMLQENLKNTKLYQQVETMGKDLENKTVELVKSLGGEIPAAVIGVGIKAGIEKKIGVQGSSDVVPVNYEVSIGLEESNFKIKNDKIFEKNIETWLSGTYKDNHQKIEIGLKYDF